MAEGKKERLNLVVQIPAFNEQDTIARVIQEIPKSIPGISSIRILVIDDGSSDKTAEVARKEGAVVIRNKMNLGLARAFKAGIEKALEMKADIIVNTDADNQYNQKEIPKLIQPIIDEEADIVSGDRQVEKLHHMPSSKKYGNMIGSAVVSNLMPKENIRDASSGFRAYSREAALRLFILSHHTYTHETLIQASNLGLKIVEVPVEFRKRQADDNSRLIGSVYGHIKKSSSTIARTTLMYNSLKALSYIGSFLIILGLIPLIRWYYLSYLAGEGGMHIQSLLLGALLMIFGGLIVVLGFLADLIAINRQHLEDISYRLKKIEYGQ